MLVPTPYSIMQSDSRDVFAEIVTSGDHAAQFKEALWAEFGDTGIGNPDVDYWVRRMKGKYRLIMDEYELKAGVFDAVKAGEVDFADRNSTVTTRRSGKDTSKVTNGGTYKVTNNLQSAEYDPPSLAGNVSTVTNYMSSASRDTGDVTTDDQRTVTTEITPGITDTTTTVDSSGLLTESAKAWMDAVHDPYPDFADEFSDLFYWGL